MIILLYSSSLLNLLIMVRSTRSNPLPPPPPLQKRRPKPPLKRKRVPSVSSPVAAPVTAPVEVATNVTPSGVASTTTFLQATTTYPYEIAAVDVDSSDDDSEEISTLSSRLDKGKGRAHIQPTEPDYFPPSLALESGRVFMYFLEFFQSSRYLTLTLRIVAPYIGSSSSSAFNPDAALEPSPIAGTIIDDFDEELDMFGGPLFPPPVPRRSVTPAEPSIPAQIPILIHFRIGEPLTHRRPRKNLPGPSPIQFVWDEDSYDGLCLKIRRKVSAIPSSSNVEWGRDSNPHLQPYHTATAHSYVSLDNSNCCGQLRKAWIKEFRRTRKIDLACNVYVYLNETQEAPLQPTVAAARPRGQPPAPQFRRATQQRILTQRAIIQQQPDLQHLGPIETAHLSRTSARLPPSNAPIEVPTTNTFRQMRHLDQEAAGLHLRQTLPGEQRSATTTLRITVAGGINFDIQFDIGDLRAKLGIPNMNLDGLANFQEAELNDPQEDIEDVDHALTDNE